MAQIIPPKMNVFNYGQAVEQGNRNALAQQQIAQMPEKLQMDRERFGMQKQGFETNQRTAQLQQAQIGLNQMLQEGRFVSDQPSYDAWRQKYGAMGIIQPDKMQPQYTPDYMMQVMGQTEQKAKQFTLSPGQRRYDPSGRLIAEAPQEPKDPKPIELTPGQKKLDETFAKDYSDYVAAGGYADVNKQLNQLRTVKRQLNLAAGIEKPKEGEKTYNLTGPGLGMLPESVLARTNPEAVAARNAVEEVVQRNLRLVLGAQFTEKEGERLIARAYNPSLDEKENAKRISRLIGQIEQAAKAKQRASDYFEKNGTLKGFKGKLWTKSDFGLDDSSQDEAPPNLLDEDLFNAADAIIGQ